MGKHLHQDRLSTYAKEGEKVFIFDEELKNKGNLSWADWFDSAFSQATEVTMEKLRKLFSNIQKKKSIVSQAETALKQAKNEAATAQADTYNVLGANFLNKCKS